MGQLHRFRTRLVEAARPSRAAGSIGSRNKKARLLEAGEVLANRVRMEGEGVCEFADGKGCVRGRNLTIDPEPGLFPQRPSRFVQPFESAYGQSPHDGMDDRPPYLGAGIRSPERGSCQIGSPLVPFSGKD